MQSEHRSLHETLYDWLFGTQVFEKLTDERRDQVLAIKSPSHKRYLRDYAFRLLDEHPPVASATRSN